MPCETEFYYLKEIGVFDTTEPDTSTHGLSSEPKDYLQERLPLHRSVRIPSALHSPSTMGVDMMAGTVKPTPTRHTSHQANVGAKAVAIPKAHSITR